MRLALALGGMTVEEMLERMTSAELTTWRAFNLVEKIGYERFDLQAGIIAAAVFNANRSKNSKVHSPIDHMPFLKYEKDAAHKAMSVEDQVKVVFEELMRSQK